MSAIQFAKKEGIERRDQETRMCKNATNDIIRFLVKKLSNPDSEVIKSIIRNTSSDKKTVLNSLEIPDLPEEALKMLLHSSCKNYNYNKNINDYFRLVFDCDVTLGKIENGYMFHEPYLSVELNV